MHNDKKYLVIILMLSAVVIRFMNILPNFSPVVGLTLFGAALLNRKLLAFILPLVLIYASDFFINNTFARGFYPEVEGLVWYSSYMIWNSIAYVLIASLGYLSLRKGLKFSNTLLITILSSVIFFAITNFGSWLDPKMMYPSSLSGLILSYEAALPFFRTSLISDLLFSAVLFGSYAILNSLFFVPKSKSVA